MTGTVVSPRTSASEGDLISIIAEGGERTCPATERLLGLMGFTRADDEAVQVPVEFLFGLGIALRLYGWEMKGLRVHREAGLPAARELLAELLRRTHASGHGSLREFSAWLRPRFLAAARRFATCGPRVLGAEVVMGDADEEELVEALARLCWACRRSAADATEE